jgi:hypothetical protein
MADPPERFLEATDHGAAHPGGGASASDQEEQVAEARQVARVLQTLLDEKACAVRVPPWLSAKGRARSARSPP